MSSTTSPCWKKEAVRTSSRYSARSTSWRTTPTARAVTSSTRLTGGCGASTMACASTSSHKLRTVIWDFAGEAVPDHVVDDLGRLVAAGLPDALEQLLSGAEAEARPRARRPSGRRRDLPRAGRRPPALSLASRLTAKPPSASPVAPSRLPQPPGRHRSDAHGTVAPSVSSGGPCCDSGTSWMCSWFSISATTAVARRAPPSGAEVDAVGSPDIDDRRPRRWSYTRRSCGFDPRAPVPRTDRWRRGPWSRRPAIWTRVFRCMRSAFSWGFCIGGMPTHSTWAPACVGLVDEGGHPGRVGLVPDRVARIGCCRSG